MPVSPIKSGMHLRQSFELSWFRRYLRIHLESDKKVEVCVFDDEQYEIWKRGEELACYGPPGERSYLNARIYTGPGKWNLVIVNRNKETVAVSYHLR